MGRAVRVFDYIIRVVPCLRAVCLDLFCQLIESMDSAEPATSSVAYSFMEINHEIISRVILSLLLIQGQFPFSDKRMCTNTG